jgi:hypothetical protein
MRIAVKDLHPNPFRDLKRYPVKPEKVEALRKSMRETTFWDNLLARKAPDGDGYELAYGHNRWEALKREHQDEIEIPVRKLTDTEMAKIMAHENMEEWGSSADIEAETVRAIIKGYGNGRIELPPVPIKNADKHTRYAPRFNPADDSGTSSDHPYTPNTLAKFLGWNESKIEAILNVLAITEEGLLDERDTVGLTIYQAEAAAKQARRISAATENPKLGKAIGKRLAAGMHTATGRRPGVGGSKSRQSVTVHSAREAAEKMLPAHERRKLQPPSSNKLPPIEQFAEQVARDLVDIPSSRMRDKLDALVKFKDHLSKSDRRLVIGALRGVAKRVEQYAGKLEG